MHIQRLCLETTHLADQKAFYTETLGLPLAAEAADSFTVQAGTTRLCFQNAGADALYHVAFTIPRNTFLQAKVWLQQRLVLLRNKAGEDELFFSNVNARSVYFCDPAGNILEYMVHYDLAQEAAGTFGPAPVLHVSEIGLPVEDVPALAAHLQAAFAIGPYRGSVSEAFAYLGDIFGQFVIVKVGRPWLPTETVPARVSPVQLIIRGPYEAQVQLAPYPYAVTMAARSGDHT